MSIRDTAYPEIERTGHDGSTYTTFDTTQPSFVRERFVGAVLCDREHNYYDDSDGYSHVWNGERVTYVGTWTTRGGSFHLSTKVDAFDGPFVAEIEAWLREWLVARLIEKREQQYASDLYDAQQPIKGRVVRVVRGRKVPIGTVGEVIWTGERSYSYHSTETRVGIRDDEGNVHWTAAKNVEVVAVVVPDPEDYDSEAQMRERAAGMDLRALHGVFCAYGSARAGLVRL